LDVCGTFAISVFDAFSPEYVCQSGHKG
jgi:hypothetical protein